MLPGVDAEYDSSREHRPQAAAQVLAAAKAERSCAIMLPLSSCQAVSRRPAAGCSCRRRRAVRRATRFLRVRDVESLRDAAAASGQVTAARSVRAWVLFWRTGTIGPAATRSGVEIVVNGALRALPDELALAADAAAVGAARPARPDRHQVRLRRRAPAAPAPCTSTARRVRSCVTPLAAVRRQARRHDRGARQRRAAASAAAGLGRRTRCRNAATARAAC